MASNQTEHCGLSQWSLTDDVRMEDFNADNAKIDAALGALTGAYTPENKPYVVGGYDGDGAETRVISLGFTPSAVLVFGNGSTTNLTNRYLGGLALPGRSAGSGMYSEWVTDKTALIVVEGGFQVGFNNDNILTNSSLNKYNYIAFR